MEDLYNARRRHSSTEPPLASGKEGDLKKFNDNYYEARRTGTIRESSTFLEIQ
jgi:hypothetical protein